MTLIITQKHAEKRMSQARFPYKKIVSSILATLPQEKARNVLVRRFGLEGDRETLQEIGSSYGITRERVRQIEEFGLKALRAKKDIFDTYAQVFTHFEDHLRERGNLRREDRLLKDLGDQRSDPHVFFLLTLARPLGFSRKGETDELHTSWYKEKEALDRAHAVVAKVSDLFRKSAAPLSEQDLIAWQEEALPEISQAAFLSYVDASKAIEKNPFGEYGLREFPEICPRGMRDEAYIVLKKGGTPLHFKDVAKAVTQYRKKYLKEGKSANPQTIHNELIKDARFVLVGRGMYALKEWGYAPGVVRDVIVQILTGAQKPMPKDEIVRLVKKQRFVQDNTIFLNLHNKKYFKRTDDGHFTLRA